MFKFLKQLANNKGVSYVADRELELKILSWLMRNNFNFNSFGVILSKLGFDPGKTIYLKRRYEDLCLSFYYSEDPDNFNKDNMISLIFPNRINVYDAGQKTSYDCCVREYVEDKIYLEKIEEHIVKKMGGLTYTYLMLPGECNTSLINIHFSYDDYDEEFMFTISMKNDVIKNYGIDFEIKNEAELQEYLMGLTFPVAIEDVYMRICEISLGDLGKYANKITLSNNKIGDYSSFGSFVKYSIDLEKEKFEIISKDKIVSYNRSLSSSSVGINVKNGDYNFSLGINFKDMAPDGFWRLDNEMELQRYLMNLTFTISIVDVYKKICEISLGDVSKYLSVTLSCYTGDYVDMNFIKINEGNFETLKMTKNGKTVFLDKDGNFSYEISDLLVDFSVNISNQDETKFEIYSKSDEKVDEYINSLIQYDVSDARKEKEDVKKLVRTIFNSNVK